MTYCIRNAAFFFKPEQKPGSGGHPQIISVIHRKFFSQNGIICSNSSADSAAQALLSVPLVPVQYQSVPAVPVSTSQYQYQLQVHQKDQSSCNFRARCNFKRQFYSKACMTMEIDNDEGLCSG
jgi:hypothetical protein